jgi:hypothetical protein
MAKPKITISYIGISGGAVKPLNSIIYVLKGHTGTIKLSISIDAYSTKNVAKKSPDSQGCFYCKTG